MSSFELQLLPARRCALPAPDQAQHGVIVEVAAGRSGVVLGAPGTGKSTLALQCARELAAGGGQVVILAASRQRSSLLRDMVAEQGWAPELVSRISVRTPPALALSIVRTWAVQRDVPLAPPVLLTGAAADARLAALLAADEAAGGEWPEHVPAETRRMRQFRAELRSLFDAVGSAGWDSQRLRELGQEHLNLAWGPCARILAGYEAAQELGQGGEAPTEIDHLRVCLLAGQLIEGWEEEASAHGVVGAPPIASAVLVDDAQDLTLAAAGLVEAMERAGSQVVLFGDPDTAVETFRGAEPTWLARRAALARGQQGAGAAAGAPGALFAVLPGCYRSGGAVRTAVQAVCQHVPPLGEISRRAAAQPAQAEWGEVCLTEVTQETELAARIADLLRSEHVRRGLEWDQMAVIVRSGALERALSEELAALGVPVAPPRERLPLSDNPVVRVLLDVAKWAASGQELPEHLAWQLVRSALVGLDSLGERKLRRQLLLERRGQVAAPAQGEARAEAGPADPVAAVVTAQQEESAGLAALLLGEGKLDGPVAGARAILSAARRTARPGVRPGALLWAAWEASGRGPAWQERVIATVGRDVPERLSIAALERDLDAVVELARRADLWEQANPTGSFETFVHTIESGVVRSDSIAAAAQRPPLVQILTPAAAAGRQWRTVVLAGLEEGNWPNPMLRDSFLGASVVRAVARAQMRGVEYDDDLLTQAAEVVVDEARMLVSAAGRAQEKIHAFHCPQAGMGSSRFLPALALGSAKAQDAEETEQAAECAEAAEAAGAAEVAGSAERAGQDTPAAGEVARQSTLAGYAASLRRQLLDEAGSGQVPSPADPRVRLLAALALLGVAGASPQEWRALGEFTPAGPLVAPGQKARISPSGVEYALKCPARWALQQMGGASSSSDKQEQGTLVHAFAEAYPLADQADDMRQACQDWALTYPKETIEQRRYVAEVEAMVELLAQYNESVTCDVMVEHTLRVEQDTRVISGRIDRIELAEAAPEGQMVRIVDFKTGGLDKDHCVLDQKGRRQSAHLAGHPQLGIYQYLLDTGEMQAEGVAGALAGRLVNVRNKCKTGATKQEQGQLGAETAWVEALLDQAEQLQRGKSFVALTGDHCRSCPVQTSCPAQRKGKRIR
ncbi:MAG: PD-(D/E)XK nuclease family protein [Buchananella hordeovulneris]|nr:PD-(D/E)XK nuclease family protein [Buchananella hordeovulneris]